jgi:putative radical SAM enzyme (TIGR03279 family)
VSGSYESAVQASAPGGIVASVVAGGPASRAGLRPGDVVLAVDGLPVRDVIDWQWLTTEETFAVEVEGGSGRRLLGVVRDWDEPVGIAFAHPLFDGVRECDNACLFCFVSQLPKGLRPALYVRDDDIRLSFLAGTFVTLTNLTDADVERIVEQRLSPLHVSLHAVDPDVRRRLVCPTVEDIALERFDELDRASIELHVQIVLVPGVNDGEVLERTLSWLAGRSSVDSVGVVPLGYTAHQSRFAVSFGDAAAAGSVLDALEPWRARMGTERGARWVHAADELYLAADRPLPPEDDYDGFPQYENGIGLVRAFIDEWDEAIESCAVDLCRAPLEVTLITGELFAPVMRALAPQAARHGLTCRVLAVPNAFFGGNVSVSGLLTGADIAGAVRAHDAAGPYLVPDIVLNDDGLTLDGMTIADLVAATGTDTRVVSCDAAGLLTALLALSDERSD